MENNKANNGKQDADETHLISRKKAISKIGKFAVISAATMMVVIPGKAQAEASAPTPSYAPPPPPPEHGIF